jgi:hypothetical protein
MRFDPGADAKSGNTIPVEQRRFGERFVHAENVTGFRASSNLAMACSTGPFQHLDPRNHPHKSPKSQKTLSNPTAIGNG